MDCRIVDVGESVLLNFQYFLNEANRTFPSSIPLLAIMSHNSWIILRFQKSTPVRYHIIPHEFNSDPNFSDTFATLPVLIQLRFCRKKNHAL